MGLPLQPTGKRRDGIRQSPFSPLFNGATSATATEKKDHYSYFDFQSPILRGYLCNSAHGSDWKTSCSLSVPYSTGLPLQPLVAAAPVVAVRAFSPLFYGATSATSKLRVHTATSNIFQSPILRGYLCNKAVHGGGRALSFSFSPLFYGATSATQQDGAKNQAFLWRNSRKSSDGLQHGIFCGTAHV